MNLGKLKVSIWSWVFVTLALFTGFFIGKFSASTNGVYSNVIIEEHVRHSLNPEIIFFITVHHGAKPSTVCFVRLLNDGLLESWCESGVGLGFGSLGDKSDFYLNSSEVESVEGLLQEIVVNWEPTMWMPSDDFVVMISFWTMDNENSKLFRSYSCYQNSCRAVVCSVLDLVNSVSVDDLGISKKICPR